MQCKEGKRVFWLPVFSVQLAVMLLLKLKQPVNLSKKETIITLTIVNLKYYGFT